MPSGQLSQRVCHVTVGSLLLEGKDGVGLDVSFKVKKTLQPHPNTCDLDIYNLNEDHRKALEQSTTVSKSAASPPGTGGVIVPVRIDAGYKDQVSQVWLGELRSSQTSHDGTNNITNLTTGDGDKAVTRQRINVSFGAGTAPSTAMRALLSSLGIGQGNLPKALKLLQTAGLVQMYARGCVLKGLAADHMTDLCRSAGLEWSIQEGQLQILTLGQPLDGKAILISATSGMVEQPTVDTKGILSVTTLMIPGIRPGIKVDVESTTLKGGYRVISCEYEGRTFDKNSPWYCHIEAQRY